MTTSRPSLQRHGRGLVRVSLAAVLAGAALTALPSTAGASVTVTGSAARASALASTQQAAVGKLAPDGCVRSGGTAACDLYAMTGTTQVLGTSIPIWGFSTSGATGSATAPGATLVVNEGDTVSVTLHNQLPENVSLAFPGQPASAFTAGLAGATTGASPSGTATYTFKASRPGTYLYEAGHTPDGTRQVAMGLAGALVVLASDGTAAGHSYDDDAVMVLSEIDPALNAHPTTFDMRGFKARYRLINGRPFPTTSPVPTDQGHTVLLRYVNAGTTSHTMATLGATQLKVDEDGHKLAQAEREVVATLDSGMTTDTLVTMPTGPETKVTLFETGSHLDNNGQTELDPGRIATGGMLTFLDTNAPPPSDDHVGPVSAHATASPNPSNGRSDVTVTADFNDVKTGGSAVDAAELTVDDPTDHDVAPGSGLPMTGSFGSVSVTGATGVIPAVPLLPATCDSAPIALSCLSAGKHIVYVRGHDANNNWGVVGSVVLNLPKTGPSTTNGSVDAPVTNGTSPLAVSATGDDTAADGSIDQAELFLDTAGADGTGLSVAQNIVSSVVSEDALIPTVPPSGQSCPTAVALSCLTQGTHHVLVHSHDTLGLWGPVLDIPFVVDTTGPGVDGAAVSPNPTNAVISSPGNTGYLKISAQITDVDSRLTRAEAFFAPSSATPKAGTGLALLAVDGKYDSSTEPVYGLIPLSQVKPKADGSYQVYVRCRDEAGNWGDLFAVPVVVDKTAPVLASLSGAPNPTNGAALLTLSAPVTRDTSFQTAEFWTGTTDPGVGKGTRVSVAYVSGSATAIAPLAGITPGSVRFNMRVQDMAGNWSNAVNTTVTVSKPNAIFADTFDGGNLSAWSARTNTGGGSMTTSAAAGIPLGGANLGLSVTGSGTHYVTDNSPAAETGYHASFGFSPNTFTSGSATAVTIFTARTTTASAFTVDYRKNAGVSQVRVVMSRSGAAAVTGTWVNLAAGAHSLRVDWTSGPATGSAQGSLRLSVDGTSSSTLSGNTSSLRIEAVRLGLVAGMTASSTGTGYFDSFQSTRNTLP
ncbi:MAG: multicopper oxidase family protein [Nocardioidaceae bacterium]